MYVCHISFIITYILKTENPRIEVMELPVIRARIGLGFEVKVPFFSNPKPEVTCIKKCSVSIYVSGRYINPPLQTETSSYKQGIDKYEYVYDSYVRYNVKQ